MVEFALAVASSFSARFGMAPGPARGGGERVITRPLFKLAIAAMLALVAYVIPINEAKAQDQLMVTPQGSNEVIGRWREVLVQLNNPPSSGTEVTVTFSSGARLFRYNPSNQIVLDSTEPVTLSVTWYEARNSDINNVPITSSATGGYSGTVTRITFTRNRFFLYELQYDGNIADHSRGRRLDADLEEGSAIQVTVEFSGNPRFASIAPITVSIAPRDGADDRAQIVGSDTSVVSLPESGGPDRRVSFDISATGTGVPAGVAEFEVRILSSDGAFMARTGADLMDDFSYSPSDPLRLRLNILPDHGIVSSPGDTITVPPDGSSEHSFRLNRPPSSGMVTLTVGLVPTGTLPDGVALALDPMSPAELVFDTTDWDQEQSVRVVQSFTGDDTTLDEEIGFELRVTAGSSTDSGFNSLELTVSGIVQETPVVAGAEMHLGQALGSQAAGLGPVRP